MFNSAKYVVMIEEFVDSVFIFPCHLTHADIARGLSGTPASAGFVRMVDNEAVVFGNSVSLGLGPKEGDVDLITELLTQRPD